MQRALTPYVFARLSIPIAVGLAALAVLVASASDESWPFLLISVGGVLALIRGYVSYRNVDGVRDQLSAQEQSGLSGQLGFRIETKYGAAVLMAIGLGWIAFGIAQAL